MAVASFEELCAGFCELVKVPTPELKADQQGLVAFHVVLRGATVILAHRPATSENHFFVLFELGHIGADGADAVAELQALLDANFVLLRVNTPVFSRNPATGEGVLQYVYSLFDATPIALHQLIETEIDRISHWRENVARSDVDGSSIASQKPTADMLLQMA